MSFNLDQVKGLWNVVREKGIEYAGVAADKTKEAARVAKLTMELTGEKETLKKAYCELGKAYYEEHHAEAEGLFAQLCGEVDAVSARVNAMQAELDELKSGFAARGEAADFETVVSQAEDPDITVEVIEETESTEE